MAYRNHRSSRHHRARSLTFPQLVERKSGDEAEAWLMSKTNRPLAAELMTDAFAYKGTEHRGLALDVILLDNRFSVSFDVT